MSNYKRLLPDVLAVLLFVILAFAYFFPADFEGRILFRHDMLAGVGAGKEAQDYLAETGQTTRWTNRLFSGMPMYQISPSYPSGTVLAHAINAYHLWLPETVWYLFVYLLGFYILLRAFDFRQHLAVLGSIMWSFSSYFLIIIAAAHIWKVWALAYLPPMIAGLVLAYYRGKYMWGLAVTALFTAFEIKANHVQMTYYYLLLVMSLMILAWLVEAVRAKRYMHFVKATAACVLGGAIGILCNLSTLYHTWQYTQESMRGKSELVKKNVANQTASGLERAYVTQWSYGIGETWTLLVPNTKGGATMPLSDNETAMKHADPNYANIYQQIGQYWGEQPGTSGPVYVGAFVLFLFVLGLFIVKGPMKWAMLVATVMSILLSWGKNFMGLTDFFLDYVPMYTKFRTVASILVVAEFTIPLLAIVTLRRILDEPDILARKIKYVYISFGLTGGMCLLFALMPTVFFPNYVSTDEMESFSQIPSDQLLPFLQNLTEMRMAMFTSDCWRSLAVIVVGVLCLLLFRARKLKPSYTVAALTVLCLVDLWPVNKRYLYDEMFVERTKRDNPVQKTATDEIILQDKTLDFRVLNMASNTFNENETSYFHNSIGGYHAAKLRRYQELIEAYIKPELLTAMKSIAEAQGDMTQVNGDSLYPVLNMLNTRYFIMPLQSGRTVPIQNPYTHGNAWFVDKIDYVENANQELDGLGTINLRHEAVADQRFRQTLGEAVQQDTSSVVTLTKYEPNRLQYDIRSGKGGIVVFSEIYYPGWKVTIDGKSADLGRVDYVLRALQVAPGEHKVELSFFPTSLDATETVAYVSFMVLLLLFGLGIWDSFRKRKPTEETV